MNKPLQSNRKAFQNLTDITINSEAITDFINSLEISKSNTSELNLFEPNWNLQDLLKLTLIFNSMNFCYWAKQEREKWAITLNQEKLDGSIALVKLVEKLAIEDSEFLNWSYLAELSINQFSKFFTASNVEIPLLQERYQNLVSLANYIQENFNCDSSLLLKESRNCAVKMLKKLIKMDCFMDQSVYKGQIVYFWKRGQLQVKMFNDLNVSKGNKPMQNLHTLTAFADYKVPQILRHLGILVYSARLSTMVDNYELIEKDSDLENEIRIATIVAVDRIAEYTNVRGMETLPSQIDSLLWNRAAANVDPMKPYHRTYTKAY